MSLLYTDLGISLGFDRHRQIRSFNYASYRAKLRPSESAFPKLAIHRRKED